MEKGQTAGSWTFIIVFIVFVACVIGGFYFYNKFVSPQKTDEQKDAEQKAQAEKDAKIKALEQEKKELELANEDLNAQVEDYEDYEDYEMDEPTKTYDSFSGSLPYLQNQFIKVNKQKEIDEALANLIV